MVKARLVEAEGHMTAMGRTLEMQMREARENAIWMRSVGQHLSTEVSRWVLSTEVGGL